MDFHVFDTYVKANDGHTMHFDVITDKKNNEVFVFNGWMFSSSPSLTPFDHPVYDIWLVQCY